VLFYSPEKVKQLELRGRGILSRFYKRHVAIRNSGVVLSNEETFDITIDDFIVTGKIDRKTKEEMEKK